MEKLHFLVILLVSVSASYLATNSIYEGVNSNSGQRMEGKKVVLDCSAGRCIWNTLDTAYKVGECTYEEYGPGRNLNMCSNTSKSRVEEVSMVGDNVNHITGGFSEGRISSTEFRTGITDAWDIAFLPNNSMIFTSMDGKVWVFDPDTGNKTLVEDLKSFHKINVGLMGLAIDPDFEQNRRIYVMNSVNISGPHNAGVEILSYRLIDGDLRNETQLTKTIGVNPQHGGGRLLIGPENKLFAAVGDGHRPISAQNVSDLAGKILRINPDGTVPEDNPFNNSYVYSIGHRNPEGLAWNPETSRIYSSEHGTKRKDEINLIQPGHNYGWGLFRTCRKEVPPWFNRTRMLEQAEQVEPRGELVEPLKCYRKFTMAPAAMEFVHNRSSRWYGTLFVAGLRGKHIRKLELDQGRIVGSDIFFVSNRGRRLRDLEYHEGRLYALSDQPDIMWVISSNKTARYWKTFPSVSEVDGGALSRDE